MSEGSAPATHDYTHRYWGHDYAILRIEDSGKRLSASGWGRGLAVGDFMLLQNEGSSTRYKVEEISYKSDPPDMWSATLSFAPRTKEST